MAPQSNNSAIATRSPRATREDNAFSCLARLSVWPRSSFLPEPPTGATYRDRLLDRLVEKLYSGRVQGQFRE